MCIRDRYWSRSESMTWQTRRRSQRFIRHIFEDWHICGPVITLPRPQSFRRSSLTPASLDGVSLVPWPGSSTPEPSTQWVWTPQHEFHTKSFSPFGRMLTRTYRSIRPRGPSTKRCATVTNGNNRRTSLSVSLSVPGDELGTHPPQPYFRSTVSTLIISLFHRPSFSLAYGDPGAARTRIILGQ